MFIVWIMYSYIFFWIPEPRNYIRKYHQQIFFFIRLRTLKPTRTRTLNRNPIWHGLIMCTSVLRKKFLIIGCLYRQHIIFNWLLSSGGVHTVGDWAVVRCWSCDVCPVWTQLQNQGRRWTKIGKHGWRLTSYF